MTNYLRPVAAFDVDNTLIDDDENPREQVVQLFVLLQRFGCRMVIWSGNGVEYATRIAGQLELDAKILEKGSIQPDITVDDVDMFTRISEKTLGRVNIKV